MDHSNYLPQGWIKELDKDTGYICYRNTITKQYQWVKPAWNLETKLLETNKTISDESNTEIIAETDVNVETEMMSLVEE